MRFDESGVVNEGSSQTGNGRFAHQIEKVPFASTMVYITEFEDDASNYFVNQLYTVSWNRYGDRGPTGWTRGGRRM